MPTVEELATPEVAEYSSKHLEAAFIFRLNHHRHRILQGFDEAEHLPKITSTKLKERVEQSEKRYGKAYGLLSREQPLAVPHGEDGISRDLIVALADNLAWKGIENYLTTAHLDEIDRALNHLRAKRQSHHNGAADLRSRQKDLKVIALEDNHFYRDFFDSQTAHQIGVDSPAVMRKFLKKSSLNGNSEESVEQVACGLSLEIAARRYLGEVVRDDVAVGFGSDEQDAQGGDIVLSNGSTVIYVDLKNRRPDDLRRDPDEGFTLHADNGKGIYKAVVWSESREPVSAESFRLTDPALKSSLVEVVQATGLSLQKE